MKRIYITRHGLTDWNIEGRLQGHEDSPLTKQGEEDALALSLKMKKYPIDIVYSSPLLRAFHTASLIFPNKKIIQDDRLKEMSFGIYEGKQVKDLLEDELYDNLWNHPEKFDRIENGESYKEVKNRLLSFLDDLLLQPESHVFLTIHGMLYVVLMSIIKELSVEQYPLINREIIRGGSLTIIDFDKNGYTIITEGMDGHLNKDVSTPSFIKK